MPRLLLRDGEIVVDDWTRASGADERPAPEGSGALIITIDEWLKDRGAWRTASRPLGLIVPPTFKIEHLQADLPRFGLIAADFPGPADGRGYTQGRLLRERLGFRGELRAAGYVRLDQVFLLARCGFNSFELPESELSSAVKALTTFSARYQPTNDSGLRRQLDHR